MKARIKSCALACAVALVVAACDQGATSPVATDGPSTGPAGPQLAVGDVISKPAATALGEKYVICKTGPTSTFNVTANGVPVSGSPFTVNDGECKIVYEAGGETVTVASSENVPSGVQLDKVVKTQLTCGLGLGDECDPATSPVVDGPTEVFTGPLAGPTTSGTFAGFAGGTGPSSDRSQKGLSGVLVEYFNSVVPTGGEGCTPGYWKQEHHFDSWVTYNPGDDFDTVFGVDLLSPDITLLEALEAKGGGVNALARHAVAALLNATSGVDYDLTEAQVIAAVQAAVSSGDFEATKDLFEGFNEQGCPLN